MDARQTAELYRVVVSLSPSPAIVGGNLTSGKEKAKGSAVADPADPLLAPLPSNPTLEGVPTL
jgi:hypothetical protein